MTVEKAFDKFILSRKLSGLSEKTIQDYRDFVGQFIRYVGSEEEIENLTQEDIDTYIEYQIDRDISRTTRSTYIRNLKIFIRWICENHNVTFKYTSIKVPKSTKKNIRLYSNQEIELIFESISTSEQWIVERNKAIIAFMLDSGLRQGEICTLKREWINTSNGIMTVHGKGDKERTVPLGKMAIKMYEQYIELCPYQDIEYAFLLKSGKPMSCNSVKLMVTKLAKKLPFELSSHKLRHNFATNYCLNMYKKYGHIDIFRLMVIMGHEDIETTRRYLHLANEIIASTETISHMDIVYKIG